MDEGGQYENFVQEVPAIPDFFGGKKCLRIVKSANFGEWFSTE